jgi:predicted ArsR family transcriptional regulator
MANNRYAPPRKKLILDVLAQRGSMTNKEIGEAMGLSYRCIQPLTQDLEFEGHITGYVNCFRRVSEM